MNKSHSDEDALAIRMQLDRIVQSGPFAQSRRRQRFLQFIVNETLAGRGDRLKGYYVALEVFDRPNTFDPVTDPVVRIEAARLREKLREYYSAEGRDDPVRIELPKGTYTPHIAFCRTESPDSSSYGSAAPAQNGHHAPIPRPQNLGEERLSIAVLPFASMSASREYDYLAEGFADTLITELAKISSMFVVSRQSSFAYRNTREPLPHIAATLRVRYLIEGSVHTEQERMRMSVNLIDTATDRSLWAERYEGSVNDIFRVEDELCRSIVRALPVEPTTSEAVRIGQLGTRSSEAHHQLLRGLEKYWLYTREACAEAQRHFARATSLDPHYATAHAWLARAYVFQTSVNWAPEPKTAIELAIQHARRAIELDEQLPLAHSILGWSLLESKDGENAISAGRRAAALDPRSAEAKLYLACILAATGHGEESLHNIETAMLLQPHPSACYFDVLGCCHFALGDFDRAIAAFRRGVEINPDFITCHYQLAVTHAIRGEQEAARAEAAIVKADWPHVSVDFFLDPRLKAIWQRGKEIADL
ncbi:MAG: tetratricopeptide repeat protein [Hyphomicrobium sp.]